MAAADRIVPAAPAGAAKKRKRLIDWSAVAFVASLCLFAFLYGFASNELDLPPKSQMKQAVAALKAINVIDDNLPTGVNRLDPNAKPEPEVRQLDAAAGKELLLVTGWPNRDPGRCPKFGCLASVIDRSGRILHSWPLPSEALFDGVQGFDGEVKPHQLLSDRTRDAPRRQSGRDLPWPKHLSLRGRHRPHRSSRQGPLEAYRQRPSLVSHRSR